MSGSRMWFNNSLTPRITTLHKTLSKSLKKLWRGSLQLIMRFLFTQSKKTLFAKLHLFLKVQFTIVFLGKADEPNVKKVWTKWYWLLHLWSCKEYWKNQFSNPKTYSEPCQMSKVEPFAKIIDSLTNFEEKAPS